MLKISHRGVVGDVYQLLFLVEIKSNQHHTFKTGPQKRLF